MNELNNSVPSFNKLKNSSLYINFENNKFISPSEIISQELSNQHIKKAKAKINNGSRKVKKYLQMFSDANPSQTYLLNEFLKLLK